jgi:flagellar hook-associated protein 3 FlgL
MRVTQNTTATQVMNNLQTIMQRQAQLEQYASTGVKVSNPGDNPVAAQQILHLKSITVANEQYARNITTGTSILTVTESAMSSLGDQIVRAKELALSMANGTNNSSSRSAAVNELTQLKSQVIALGNTEFNGKFIFGGFKNDTAPFDAAGAFTGTNDDLKVEIAQGSFVPVTYSGEKLISGGNPPGSTGTDIIGIFDDLIDAVTAGDSDAIRSQLDKLDNAQGQVLTARSDIGSRMNRLTSASSINDDMKLSITKVLSDIQDVDYAQVISDLSKQQTAFQTAAAASAKVSQVSLLDYLK